MGNRKKCKCKNVFQDVMESFALEQLITEPTRVTGTTSTLIDHVYVSDPHRIVSSGILKVGLSDHYAVWAVHHNKCERERNSKTHKVIEYRAMKNFDPVRVKNDKRDELKAYLAQNGISSAIYYPLPIYRQKAYKSSFTLDFELTNTEILCKEVLSLPICSHISDNSIKFVVSHIKKFFNT